METFFKWLGTCIFAVLIPILLVCSIAIPTWRTSIGNWLIHEQVETITENHEKVKAQLEQKMEQYDNLTNEKNILEENLATANDDILEKQGNITELNIEVAVLSQQIADLERQITSLFSEIRYLTTQLSHADTSFIDELTIRLENRGLRYFDNRINVINNENLLLNVVGYPNPMIRIDSSMLNSSLFDSFVITAYDIIDDTYVNFPIDTARFYVPNSFGYVFRANAPDDMWLQLEEQIELLTTESRITFVSETFNHRSVSVYFAFGDLPTHSVDVTNTQEIDFEMVTHDGITVEPWIYNSSPDLQYSLSDEPFTLFNPIDTLNMNMHYFMGMFNVSSGIQELTVNYLLNNEIYQFSFNYKINNFS